ncbi:MAG: methyl-accepting chemotaxis protein, partial [Paraglaciecola sp.]
MNFFNWLTSDASKREALENKRKTSMLDAIERTQAVVEFDLKGIVLSVNDNFLSVMGYDSQDVIGKHHSMFVEPAYKASDAYREFWQQLNVGDALSDVYKRIGQGGKEVWIQASYNPLLDATGKVTGVVKYATDVTEQKVRSADYSGQIDAIRKSQAVIEFNMDGIVEFANDNFLKTLDYTLDEIKGKHHSMFVAPEYKNSHTYREFWENLNAGIYSDDEIKRFGNGGKEIWLQAFYNPILDLNGKPFKVVKYATEVTQQKFQTADFSGQIDAISKAQAIIEFDMDGIVQAANDKFLNAMGYTLAEVKGKHHSMFVAPEYKSSHTYREFWENLNAGIYATDEIKRFGNGGKEIWLQASYNPILDLNGK